MYVFEIRFSNTFLQNTWHWKSTRRDVNVKYIAKMLTKKLISWKTRAMRWILISIFRQKISKFWIVLASTGWGIKLAHFPKMFHLLNDSKCHETSFWILFAGGNFWGKVRGPILVPHSVCSLKTGSTLVSI